MPAPGNQCSENRLTNQTAADLVKQKGWWNLLEVDKGGSEFSHNKEE